MKEPTGVSNTTWVMYMQKPDCTDGQVVSDIMPSIEPTYKHWFEGDFNLAAGKYSIYSVYSQPKEWEFEGMLRQDCPHGEVGGRAWAASTVQGGADADCTSSCGVRRGVVQTGTDGASNRRRLRIVVPTSV